MDDVVIENIVKVKISLKNNWLSTPPQKYKSNSHGIWCYHNELWGKSSCVNFMDNKGNEFRVNDQGMIVPFEKEIINEINAAIGLGVEKCYLKEGAKMVTLGKDEYDNAKITRVKDIIKVQNDADWVCLNKKHELHFNTIGNLFFSCDEDRTIKVIERRDPFKVIDDGGKIFQVDVENKCFILIDGKNNMEAGFAVEKIIKVENVVAIKTGSSSRDWLPYEYKDNYSFIKSRFIGYDMRLHSTFGASESISMLKTVDGSIYDVDHKNNCFILVEEGGGKEVNEVKKVEPNKDAVNHKNHMLDSQIYLRKASADKVKKLEPSKDIVIERLNEEIAGLKCLVEKMKEINDGLRAKLIDQDNVSSAIDKANRVLLPRF